MSDSLSMVRRRLSEIARLKETIETDEQELRVTERVLARLEAQTPKSNLTSIMNGIAHRAVASATEAGAVLSAIDSTKTLRHIDLITATLRTSTDPWFSSSDALHDAIKKIHQRDIPLGSFRPLLSNLKADGVIERVGSKIALAERVKGKVAAE